MRVAATPSFTAGCGGSWRGHRPDPACGCRGSWRGHRPDPACGCRGLTQCQAGMAATDGAEVARPPPLSDPLDTVATVERASTAVTLPNYIGGRFSEPAGVDVLE